MSLHQDDRSTDAVVGLGLGPVPAKSTTTAIVSGSPAAPTANPEPKSPRIVRVQVNDEKNTTIAAAVAALPTEPESPSTREPEPKICAVCQTQPGKYKCPRCTMLFCSVACNKVHKENHPPDPVPSPTAENALNPTETSTSDEPDDPYKVLLDHAHVFERLFKKYPTLSAELERIQSTTLPPSDTSSASRFPYISGRQNQKQQPWTKDVGLRKGADALRRARTDPSDTGDGVREFCDVVLYLLSTVSKQQGGEAGGVIGKVKEEVTREEKSVIERLLREESGDSF